MRAQVCNHSLVLLLCFFVLLCIEFSHHTTVTHNSFYIESFCQRNAIIHISVNRLETKETKVVGGWDFSCDEQENGKGCR